MRFAELPQKGLFLIELERLEDSRGSFARSFCVSEFKAHGLETDVVQCNVSLNARRGTLRGLHFQVAPHEEAKLVRCTRGAIFDVAVDIRPESATVREFSSLELTAQNGRMLYIPKGFAHGFQTLEDNTEVTYLMFECFRPESARGLRWDDPALAISWPNGDPIMSDKDRTYALLDG